MSRYRRRAVGLIHDIAGASQTLGGPLENMGLVRATRQTRVEEKVAIDVQFQKRSFELRVVSKAYLADSSTL